MQHVLKYINVMQQFIYSMSVDCTMSRISHGTCVTTDAHRHRQHL